MQWAFLNKNSIVTKTFFSTSAAFASLVWLNCWERAAACLMKGSEGSPAAAWCFCIPPQRSRCFPRSPPQTSSGGSALLWWGCPRTGWYAGISSRRAATDTITQHADALTLTSLRIWKQKKKRNMRLYLKCLHGDGLVLLQLVYFSWPEYVTHFLKGWRGHSNKMTSSLIQWHLYPVVVVLLICIVCLVFCFVCLQ